MQQLRIKPVRVSNSLRCKLRRREATSALFAAKRSCCLLVLGEDLLETVVRLERHVILVKVSREFDADVAVVPGFDVVTCLINPLLLEASYESEFVTVFIDPHTCGGLAELVEDLILALGSDIESKSELMLRTTWNSILTNRESDASKIS